MGAVVRSTSLLPAMKRKFPSSKITWVTDAPADQLLRGHPWVDRVLTSREADLLELSALEFDVAYVIDKSLKAVGILRRTTVEQIYGFVADPRSGAILPATPAAEELWELGLDNHQKFFVNQKPETQLMIEALELGPFQRDEYFLPLSQAEEVLARQRHEEWSGDGSIVLGINTGCGPAMPAKKLSVEFHRNLIQAWSTRKDVRLVLLGGPEDGERNREIARGLPVLLSATDRGLRDGLVSVAACDLVLTGDSLGMHMAIAQKKYCVAWFGPSCAQEIDLYGRGEKILTRATCSPCWKKLCAQTQMCYDQVSARELLSALEKGIDFVRQSDYTNSLSR